MSFHWSNQRLSDILQKLPDMTSRAGFSICTWCLLCVYWTVIFCHYHRPLQILFWILHVKTTTWPILQTESCPHSCLHVINVTCSFSVLLQQLTVSESRFLLLCHLTACWCFSQVINCSAYHNITDLFQTRPNTMSPHNKWNQGRDFQIWLQFRVKNIDPIFRSFIDIYFWVTTKPPCFRICLQQRNTIVWSKEGTRVLHAWWWIVKYIFLKDQTKTNLFFTLKVCFSISAVIKETSFEMLEITHLGFLTVRKAPSGNLES